MQVSENLSDFAKTVLSALYAAGANAGQPYATDLSSIGRQVGLQEVDDIGQVEDALRELVQKGISVEQGNRWFMVSFITKFEIIGNSQVSLVLGVPKELFEHH